jgi:hypothetical protein
MLKPKIPTLILHILTTKPTPVCNPYVCITYFVNTTSIYFLAHMKVVQILTKKPLVCGPYVGIESTFHVSWGFQ